MAFVKSLSTENSNACVKNQDKLVSSKTAVFWMCGKGVANTLLAPWLPHFLTIWF